MKILYFANVRIPTEKAHGLQIFKTCQSLADLGMEVKLVVPNRRNPGFKKVNPFEYYQVKDNFKLKKIRGLDPFWLIFGPPGIYIKFQIFSFLKGLFWYLLFKENKKDYIFYTRDEYLLPTLQIFSKNTVWEAHTLPKNKNRHFKYWKKCFKIIAISQALKNELIKLGISPDKILVAHDGVDLEKFKFIKQRSKKDLTLPENKKIIMYSGHLYNWKGVQTLADSAKYLDTNTLIVFIGGMNYDIKNFKQKNINLIKQDKILLLEHQPPSEIPSYLNSADVLVLPTSAKDAKSNYTSPLKLFEYMAVGKPIVASHLLPIQEILNNSNSILVKADAAQSFGNGIKKALSDKNLADRISKQAKIDVQKYDWQKRGEKIIQFLLK